MRSHGNNDNFDYKKIEEEDDDDDEEGEKKSIKVSKGKRKQTPPTELVGPDPNIDSNGE